MRKMLAAAVVAVCLTGTARADILKFNAVLGPEVPGATGTGSVELEWDTIARTLAIDADFSGLTGVTTVAHIHCCVAVPGTGMVGVAVTPGTLPGFPVGVTAGTYATTLDLTLATTFTGSFVTNFGGGTVAGAQAALLAGLSGGTAYFNIHTTRFPGGEIRGFLAPVPEPTALMSLGLGLLALARRRLLR
jgi:hypothetical protein